MCCWFYHLDIFELVQWMYDIYHDLSLKRTPMNIIATAILDRLLHHSHVFYITGQSYRLKEHEPLQGQDGTGGNSDD